jgi:hypothetical protein
VDVGKLKLGTILYKTSLALIFDNVCRIYRMITVRLELIVAQVTRAVLCPDVNVTELFQSETAAKYSGRSMSEIGIGEKTNRTEL